MIRMVITALINASQKVKKRKIQLHNIIYNILRKIKADSHKTITMTHLGVLYHHPKTKEHKKTHLYGQIKAESVHVCVFMCVFFFGLSICE